VELSESFREGRLISGVRKTRHCAGPPHSLFACYGTEIFGVNLALGLCRENGLETANPSSGTTVPALIVGRFGWLSLPGKSGSRELGTSDLVSCQRPPVISAKCACVTTPLVSVALIWD